MTRRKVSIKDVARAADVSITTVTHALNGKRPVSPETRDRIMKAIDELGYVPSYSASHLKNGRSNLIGCYVADLTEDFTNYMLRGIEQAIKGTGYSLVFGSAVELGTDKATIKKYFRQYGIDGLITINHLSVNSDWTTEDKAFPIVLLNSNNSHFDCILPDNRLAGALVAQHLYDNGVRKPFFFGGPIDRISVMDRLEGFRERLYSLGIELTEDSIWHGDFTFESGCEMAQRLVDEHIPSDGVMCANDYIAIGAIRRFSELGYSIPKDIKIVGVDDRDIAKYCNIPVTTVNLDLEDLGKFALERILEIIESDDHNPITYYSNPYLIPRESSAIL